VSDVVRFTHVDVVRGSRHVLQDLDFGVRAGEFVGVIGGNGAGKTTLLRVMLGLQRVSAGAVAVFGEPVARSNRRIGFVPQKIAFDRDVPLRARDFVGLGVDGERFGLPLPNASRRARVDAALADVGASAYADAPIGRLSGGEQQRLAIAQAIVGGPDLLLLDEPLANLDLRGADDVVALVAQIRAERGTTIVMVAHDVNPLLGTLDRVLYLSGGRSVIGTVPEVITSDVLGRLFGEHVDVIDVHGRLVVVTGPHDDTPSPQPLDAHARSGSESA